MSLIKLAAPRWFKEAKKLPEFFKNKIQADYAVGGGPQGLTRKGLQDYFTVSKRVKDELVKPVVERAKRTFKHGEHTVRFIEDAGLHDYKYSTPKIKAWLDNPEIATINQSVAPFRLMGTGNKTMPVAHYSLSDSLNSKSKFYSMSAAREGHGNNVVFGIPQTTQTTSAMKAYEDNINWHNTNTKKIIQ